MSQLRESRVHIMGDAATSGLDMSASPDMIEETQFYRMKNVYSDYDKTVVKRLAPVTWGTPIKEPTTPDKDNSEEIALIIPVDDKWEKPVIAGPSSSISAHRGALQCRAIASVSPETASITRMVGADEILNTSLPHDKSMQLSFLYQGTNVPAGSFLEIEFTCIYGQGIAFAINSAGVALKMSAGGTYATLSGTSGVNDGKVHEIVIFSDQAGIVRAYVDGVEKGFQIITYFPIITDHYITVSVKSDASLNGDPFIAQLSSFMLRDVPYGDTPFAPAPISAITNIKETKAATASEVTSLLVATNGYLWYDYALSEMWRPLAKLQHAEAFFGKFRGNTILCNFGTQRRTSVYSIDPKTNAVKLLENAPNLRFTAQFANRLWGAGDVDHPLRLYYSGDRQPNLWYNPDDPDNPVTIDAELGAGFFEFPGTKDDSRITYISGDFFGSLLVTTTEDTYVLTGSSPTDFSRRRLSGANGCAGPYCGVDVFNDHWLLNENGINSVMSTDKFGDLESTRLSYQVRDLFNTDKTTEVMLDSNKLNQAKMAYLQRINTVFIWAQESGETAPGVIYTVNLDTKKWSGPWKQQLTCMAVIKLRSPLKETVVFGTSDGYVKRLTNAMYSTDEAVLESAEINGRSVNPAYPTMKKAFKTFRLEITPTGAWPVTFRYKVDDDESWTEVTKYLANPSKHHVLGEHAGWTSATTGTSLTKSGTQTMVIEFPVDRRGYSFKYEIKTSAPRIRWKRWQLDMHVVGFERD